MRQRTEGTSERKQCVVQKGIGIGRTPSCRVTTLHARDGKVRARGGWAMGSEEGGRGGREKRREKQAGQTLLGGQAGRDARPSTQQKQEVPPVPPPARHNTQLRSREAEE
jgi:hypothetical protein